MATFEFAMLSLVSLLIMVNPIGVMSVFVSITSHQSHTESSRFALRASLAALAVLLVFAVVGKLIFAVFSISLESLRIVGGILFFVVGYEMLSGRAMAKRTPGEDATSDTIDQSITPIGVPLICGPGAISTVMLLMSECHSISHKVLLLVAIVAVMAVTFISLVSARRILMLIGKTGVNVIMRITGLIVMAIAVEFFIGGLGTIIPRIIGN